MIGTNFDLAIEVVLYFEGRILTNTEDDHGGLTYCGLTRRSHPDFDWDNPTVDKATDYYFQKLWMPHFDQIGDPLLAAKVFDQFVNFGNVLLVQRALALYTPTIRIDGCVGPQTIRCLNEVGPTEDANASAFLTRLCNAQLNRYRGILLSDKTQLKFKDGWFKRALWPYRHHSSPYLPDGSDVASLTSMV